MKTCLLCFCFGFKKLLRVGGIRVDRIRGIVFLSTFLLCLSHYFLLLFSLTIFFIHFFSLLLFSPSLFTFTIYSFSLLFLSNFPFDFLWSLFLTIFSQYFFLSIFLLYLLPDKRLWFFSFEVLTEFYWMKNWCGFYFVFLLRLSPSMLP